MSYSSQSISGYQLQHGKIVQSGWVRKGEELHPRISALKSLLPGKIKMYMVHYTPTASCLYIFLITYKF